MNELLKVTTSDDRITLSARELHEFLEIGTQYTKWFDRMCEYGFSEETDFMAISQKRLTAQGNETTYTDHQITIDMAKEISMLQRNEKGKQARQYFIQLEKEWNSPEKVMARALQLANKEITELKLEKNTLLLENKMQGQQIAELKPKADYTDDILKNKGLVTITAIAKDYGMSGSAMNTKLNELGVQYKQSGQWFLYAKHQNKGYTHSETQKIVHSDGREDIKMNTKWTQKGRLFIYELLKNNGIVPMIERGD